MTVNEWKWFTCQANKVSTPLTIEQKSGMLGPTINMAQGDPSKAAVFLEKTVRAPKHNYIMHF